MIVIVRFGDRRVLSPTTPATNLSLLRRCSARVQVMLSTLPAEILLEIIQFLPFTTIASSLPTLSKSWATFMDTNESSIYHSISKRYGYADSGVDTPSDGWKAWCEWFPSASWVDDRVMIFQLLINSRSTYGGLGNAPEILTG